MSGVATREGAAPTADAVEEFLGALDRLVRARRLYAGRGEMVDRVVADVMKKAHAMLEHGDITLRVAAAGLVFAGLPVTPIDEKPRPYLFQLFCDGVREITFLPGLTAEELLGLAEVLGADLRDAEADLVTRLWDRAFKHLQYYATDTLQLDLRVDAEGELTLARAREVARLESAGTQTMTLSSQDVRVLRQDDALQWVREARAPSSPGAKWLPAVRQVREAWESPRDARRFVAVGVRTAPPGQPSPLVLGAFDAALRSGDATTLGQLLEAVTEQAANGGEALQQLRKALLSPACLESLAHLYPQRLDELHPYLEPLARQEPDALVTVLRTLPEGPALARLQSTLQEAGVDLTPLYEQRLSGDDEGAVLGAIAALGRIGTPPAYKAIAGALGHTLTKVRRAALEALLGHYLPEARVGLARAMKDPDRENRMLALQVFERSADPRAAWALLSAAQEPGFGDKELAEQKAVFRALGALGDPRTLEFFTSVLSNKNLTRSRSLMVRQEMACEALGLMKVEGAREQLEAVPGAWWLPTSVKEAAKAGLAVWRSRS